MSLDCCSFSYLRVVVILFTWPLGGSQDKKAPASGASSRVVSVVTNKIVKFSQNLGLGSRRAQLNQSAWRLLMALVWTGEQAAGRSIKSQLGLAWRKLAGNQRAPFNVPAVDTLILEQESI